MSKKISQMEERLCVWYRGRDAPCTPHFRQKCRDEVFRALCEEWGFEKSSSCKHGLCREVDDQTAYYYKGTIELKHFGIRLCCDVDKNGVRIYASTKTENEWNIKVLAGKSMCAFVENQEQALEELWLELLHVLKEKIDKENIVMEA